MFAVAAAAGPVVCQQDPNTNSVYKMYCTHCKTACGGPGANSGSGYPCCLANATAHNFGTVVRFALSSRFRLDSCACRRFIA